MYEGQTFNVILQRMLDRVSNDMDKREGSIIYDALAPAAAELAQLYGELDINLILSFADTASGEYLTRRVAEFGVNRELATKARREGYFYGANQTLIDIPLGSRFSIENVSYAAISRISNGVYVLECEAAGNLGNQPFGVLLPIQYIAGLTRAELGAVIVPGEEEEADDALRVRYYETVNRPSFGGNIADYKQKINAMNGIGGVKVFPAWQGGGTVKCTIIASDWSEPSPLLVSEVQTAVDPTVNSGQGLGTAPIGHQVTIAGALGVPIHVATTVTLAVGVTASQVQERIENVIDSYLADLRHSWADQQQLIVRVSLIEAAILTVTGVIDVQDTTLNLQAANITLSAEEIPVLGTVTLDV